MFDLQTESSHRTSLLLLPLSIVYLTLLLLLPLYPSVAGVVTYSWVASTRPLTGFKCVVCVCSVRTTSCFHLIYELIMRVEMTSEGRDF